MPPSECPHAIVCSGLPTCALNRSRVAIWSGSACSIAQPVLEYDEPASAYPWLSSQPPVTGSPTSCAGLLLLFGDTYPWLYRNSVWFHCAGTSIRYVAPSASEPQSTVSPGTIGAGHAAWLAALVAAVEGVSEAIAEAVAVAPASNSTDATAAVNLRGELSTGGPPTKASALKVQLSGL